MIAKGHDTHFVGQLYFILLLFGTRSGEGFSFLSEIQNVWSLISDIWTNRLKNWKYSKMGT